MTEKKLEANRRNARLSTGPRTLEGKAAVSLNALTHGLRSRRVVLPTEDPAEFQQLCDGLTAEWQPETPTEGHLVTQIAIAIWKLDRLEALESWGEDGLPVKDGALAIRLWQQQARLERSRNQAIAELRRMRKARQVQPEPIAEAEPEAEIADLAPSPQPKPPQPEYVMRASTSPSGEATEAVTPPPIAS